ncbi:MAG: hypothetical protein AAGC86_17280 [Pseudomonadota bacterium]
MPRFLTLSTIGVLAILASVSATPAQGTCPDTHYPCGDACCSR